MKVFLVSVQKRQGSIWSAECFQSTVSDLFMGITVMIGKGGDKEFGHIHLLFDQPDMLYRGLLKLGPLHECGNIPYRFKHMNGFLKKTEDICRIEVDPILILDNKGDLPVIQPSLPKFYDLAGKFLLRAAAVGIVPAVAPEKRVEEGEDLFFEDMIKAFGVETGREGV